MHLNCGYTLNDDSEKVNDFFEKVFGATTKKDLKTVFDGFEFKFIFGEKINVPFR